MKYKAKGILTEREKQFCYSYLNNGDVKESALKAGYKINPELSGFKILNKDYINKNLDIIYKQKKKNLLYKALSGYERLAFGDISDAIKLIYSCDLSFKEIEKMDLFNISEIKKPKDGSLEIKFFDRFKALEKLQQLDIPKENVGLDFYGALERGIKALKDTNED